MSEIGKGGAAMPSVQDSLLGDVLISIHTTANRGACVGLSLPLKSGVIAREQRDRSNPRVLQDKYGGIAAHPPGARNDTSPILFK